VSNFAVAPHVLSVAQEVKKLLSTGLRMGGFFRTEKIRPFSNVFYNSLRKGGKKPDFARYFTNSGRRSTI